MSGGWAARGPAWLLRGLVAGCAAVFGLFVVLVSVNPFTASRACERVLRHAVFPFIDVAADRRDKAERYVRLPPGREWAAAIYFLWGLTIASALLTLALRYFSSSSTRAGLRSKQSSFAARGKSMVLRLSRFQVPPHSFWFWWCGGLTAGDAVVVAGWLALNIVWVQQRVVLTLPPVDSMIAKHGGKFLDWNKQESYLAVVSGALSWAATLDIMLLFYPIARSSFLHYMLGSSFPELIKYHRWLGHATMVILTLHGWGYWATWLWEGSYARGLIWDRYGTNMLAGGISWFCGAALWATSMAWIRRHHFEIFYRTHILGFLGFIIFGCIHHTGLWVYSMPGLMLYLLDVTFRIAQQAYPVRLRLADLDPGSQLSMLQFDADPRTPQHPIQWHPFTTIPGEHPATLVSVIKKYGSWTADLVQRLQTGGEVLMHVDGPYGEATSHPVWLKHPILIIFAGGIGVTPVLGMVQDIRNLANESHGVPLPMIYLHFAARQQSEIALLQSKVVSEARAAGWLDLTLYMTGRGETAKTGALLWKQADLTSMPKVEPEQKTPKHHGRHGALRMTMPPYNFGDLHWGVAHVLCLTGAVLGSVAGWYYGAQARRFSKMGAPDWQIGLTLLVASCAGCMLLPSFIIAPAHIIRALRLQRRAADAASPAAASNLLKPDPESDPGQAAPRIIKSRPDIAAILREAVEQHAEQQEVGVIAAGPEPLVENVVRVCAVHNQRVGLTGSPWLDACKYTFSL